MYYLPVIRYGSANEYVLHYITRVDCGQTLTHMGMHPTHVPPWTGFSSRKKAVVEKLVNPDKVCGFLDRIMMLSLNEI